MSSGEVILITAETQNSIYEGALIVDLDYFYFFQRGNLLG
jgi:hypothetical protein